MVKMNLEVVKDEKDNPMMESQRRRHGKDESEGIKDDKYKLMMRSKKTT